MRPPELINPPRLAQPSGFSYAVRTAGDLSVHIAGHTAMNPDGDIVGPGDLPAQFEQTLANLSETLQAAGAAPADIVRLRIYVTDVEVYKQHLGAIGKAYRKMFGRHFPAMTLVQVSRLWDSAALIEIEATAVVAAQA